MNRGFAAARAWGWDEAEVPFFEYSERSLGQSKKYFDALSVERGTQVAQDAPLFTLESEQERAALAQQLEMVA